MARIVGGRPKALSLVGEIHRRLIIAGTTDSGQGRPRHNCLWLVGYALAWQLPAAVMLKHNLQAFTSGFCLVGWQSKDSRSDSSPCRAAPAQRLDLRWDTLIAIWEHPSWSSKRVGRG